jgi:hypothetical protein
VPGKCQLGAKFSQDAQQDEHRDNKFVHDELIFFQWNHAVATLVPCYYGF